jgi:hypothetical protein
MTARQSLEPDSAATADQRQAPASRPGTQTVGIAAAAAAAGLVVGTLIS